MAPRRFGSLVPLGLALLGILAARQAASRPSASPGAVALPHRASRPFRELWSCDTGG